VHPEGREPESLVWGQDSEAASRDPHDDPHDPHLGERRPELVIGGQEMVLENHHHDCVRVIQERDGTEIREKTEWKGVSGAV
jgi:hypothetical protein